jgi:carbonic anhydrase/acetyltransferase-like protein (isoleucine patch superfamily)
VYREPESLDWRYDEAGNRERIAKLRLAGVEVWGADRVYIGPEVTEGGIEPGAVLISALVRGRSTAIGARSRVGTSGMALVVNTQLGRDVEIGAGSYLNATLFDRVKVRGCAEIRQGTVLEEEAEAGHGVGMKHTYFTSGVVAGSCINFCDLLMTGGSSRRDHSEVGSGAVHFNYDPRADKFGSLIGDSRGLLLRRRRIFIGGNSGIVAPVHIDFGAVVAAGAIVRRNLVANHLFSGQDGIPGPSVFEPHTYFDLRRKFLTVAHLCGNLHALVFWHNLVRLPQAKGMERVLCKFAVANLRLHIAHRARELDKLIAKLERFADADSGTKAIRRQHQHIVASRQRIYDLLARFRTSVPKPPDGFLAEYRRTRASMDHCNAIRTLEEPKARDAEKWLHAVAMAPQSELQRLFAHETRRGRL